MTRKTFSILLAAATALVSTEPASALPVKEMKATEKSALTKLNKRPQSYKTAAVLSPKKKDAKLGFGVGKSSEHSKALCYLNSIKQNYPAKKLAKCGSGQQPSVADERLCVDCPEGTFKDGSSTQRFCQVCPVGKEPNKKSGATRCIDCQAGYYSPDGRECIECENGYVTEKHTKCIRCTNYQYHYFAGSNSENVECRPVQDWCTKGIFRKEFPQHSNRDQNFCLKRAIVIPEKATRKGSGIINKCHLCKKEELADQTNNLCIPFACDGGQYIDVNGDCAWCPPQEYSTGKQTTCQKCPGYGVTHAFNFSRTACVYCGENAEILPISYDDWGKTEHDLGISKEDYDQHRHNVCVTIRDDDTATDVDSCQETGSVWFMSSDPSDIKEIHGYIDGDMVNGEGDSQKKVKIKVYRIRRCTNKNDLGGWIQKSSNLDRISWIGSNITLVGNANVSGVSEVDTVTPVVLKKAHIVDSHIINNVILKEDGTSDIQIVASTIQSAEIHGGTIRKSFVGAEFENKYPARGRNISMTGGTLNNMQVFGCPCIGGNGGLCSLDKCKIEITGGNWSNGTIGRMADCSPDGHPDGCFGSVILKSGKGDGFDYWGEAASGGNAQYTTTIDMGLFPINCENYGNKMPTSTFIGKLSSEMKKCTPNPAAINQDLEFVAPK